MGNPPVHVRAVSARAPLLLTLPSAAHVFSMQADPRSRLPCRSCPYTHVGEGASPQGCIDLSKRRVSAEEARKCEEKFNKGKAVNTILKHVAAVEKVPQ